jgi:hypothetical protein
MSFKILKENGETSIEYAGGFIKIPSLTQEKIRAIEPKSGTIVHNKTIDALEVYSLRFGWSLVEGNGLIKDKNSSGQPYYRIAVNTGRGVFSERGYGAVDFSSSYEKTGDQGAKGDESFASGKDVLASGLNSRATEHKNIASGFSATAKNFSNRASGESSSAQNSDNVVSGKGGHVQGEKNFSRARAEHSGGIFGTDYTPINTPLDRLVNYGNGTSDSNRSDAYTLYKNGTYKYYLLTVDELPNGRKGLMATVFDASNVTYRGIATGGGTETALVLYDGTNWIYH